MSVIKNPESKTLNNKNCQLHGQSQPVFSQDQELCLQYRIMIKQPLDKMFLLTRQTIFFTNSRVFSVTPKSINPLLFNATLKLSKNVLIWKKFIQVLAAIPT